VNGRAGDRHIVVTELKAVNGGVQNLPQKIPLLNVKQILLKHEINPCTVITPSTSDKYSDRSNVTTHDGLIILRQF
jgi:hypothetical protein